MFMGLYVLCLCGIPCEHKVFSLSVLFIYVCPQSYLSLGEVTERDKLAQLPSHQNIPTFLSFVSTTEAIRKLFE